jgi:hypothetical protein
MMQPPELTPRALTLSQTDCFLLDPAEFLPYPGAQCVDAESAKDIKFDVTPAEPLQKKYFVISVSNTLDCNGVFAAFESLVGSFVLNCGFFILFESCVAICLPISLQT